MGIEGVDVVAAEAPELVFNDSDEETPSAVFPAAVNWSVGPGEGEGDAFSDGVVAVVVAVTAGEAAGPASPVTTDTSSVEYMLPLASTSICWMTETVATTSVTRFCTTVSAACLLLWKRWCWCRCSR
jgi:hypothetical protein